VDEMLASLSQRAYLKWRKYWEAEPWGPFRDNIHAALIAQQVKFGRVKPGTRVSLDDFMVVDPAKRQRRNKAGLLAMLRLVGQPKKAPRKPRARRD
jgi:hypothetical protein